MYIDTQNSSLKLVKDETKGADAFRYVTNYLREALFTLTYLQG